MALDSIELSHDVWRTDTLKLLSKDAEYLIVKLLAKGGDIFASPQKDQIVWLDKMELSTEKKSYIETTTIPAGKISTRAVTELENTIPGYTYHSQISQQERDAIKNKVLALNRIKLLRLSTRGYLEEDMIRKKLRVVTSYQ